MFDESITDPTAGERACQRRLHPEVPQPVTDPTDPRYGSGSADRGPRAAEHAPLREPAGPERAKRA